ncbi:bifunctional 4-hydroxy-2-oxoglutarate aldolase/2-dehydro-3-deoxy-phosphogluconate aldolase [Cryptosporangium phraense]|uniref:Bifunctional 4-hydroxy-2-oxoglutarate aldolase/2-dehydro-3-deoxy-phosphogluconate aldolase n=1 Tax=Cryptosporangium phraense TaxID=2593070 RepID=A0A545AZR6_9ACTN|nr:bifunctional 4-hydroxy-2-oxoglutarate aldolase/2-dehydro-3-deoxy-phosphogluconate aldolase [Cryptosporangium phraense]TQS46820.1 bifunctional 4-hydroxy-2-oxoglutarate aldolase/2-dehydro-3-deoxy-phosphogluconate aldolase [Cryptosporangium phraense]
MSALGAMFADRVVCVVRAPVLPSAPALCQALADGGIRTVELTFTTPDVLRHLSAAASVPGVVVGVGTVLTASDARAAIDAGARFLVTPGVLPAVASVALDAGVPFLLGALTPTEVLAAADLGAAAVKVFPASAFGPRYLRDLHGPYPGLKLVPSGGVTAANAAEYLAAGAAAVTAGTGVVPPDVVSAADWSGITRRATEFTGGLT